MKITLLGTGTSQGVPVVACHCKVCTSTDKRDKHLRSSALITTDEDYNLLIDIGPDFREQMLRMDISHLDAILLTHAHRDHVAGLDDIRSYNYVQHRPMDIYGNKEAITTIQRDYRYIFSPHRYPGLPEANLFTLKGDEYFFIGKQMVQPIRGLHKELPVLGYRVGPIGYITDMNHISAEELNKLRGVQVLIVNALRHEPHFSHFCLPEALEVISTIQPDQAVLTHISHQMGLYATVEKELPPHVTLGYDGWHMELPTTEMNQKWQPMGATHLYAQRTSKIQHATSFFEGPSSAASDNMQPQKSLPYYSDSSAPQPNNE